MWRGRPRPRLSIKNTAEFFAVLVSGCVSGSDLFIPQPFYVMGHRQPKSTAFRLSAAAGGGPPTGMSTTLQQRYQYRRRLPHLQKPDADLFITFCTARLKLPASARDVVLEHSLREGGVLAGGNARTPLSPGTTTPVTTSRVRLHAVVVMPDHVHLLFSPRRDPEGWPYPLVDILQCLCCTCAPLATADSK